MAYAYQPNSTDLTNSFYPPGLTGAPVPTLTLWPPGSAGAVGSGYAPVPGSVASGAVPPQQAPQQPQTMANSPSAGAAPSPPTPPPPMSPRIAAGGYTDRPPPPAFPQVTQALNRGGQYVNAPLPPVRPPGLGTGSQAAQTPGSAQATGGVAHVAGPDWLRAFFLAGRAPPATGMTAMVRDRGGA